MTNINEFIYYHKFFPILSRRIHGKAGLQMVSQAIRRRFTENAGSLLLISTLC